MPDIYVYVHPAYTKTIFYTQTHLVFDEFRANGAHVLVGDDFRSASPALDDKLIIYGNVDFVQDVVDRFAPQNRWLYVVDEGGAGQAAYDRSLGYMKKLDVHNVVLTYQNAEHLAKITAVGRRYVIMPQCVPTIRPRIPKTGGILISGQLSASIYPTRTRLAEMLPRSVLAPRVSTLGYPGCDNPTENTVQGDKYYQHLDRFCMAITCRAGTRDRFVAKYAEMGACHVLPIGDSPSYMPRPMRRAMVDVEGKSDSDVIAEVTRLLASPEELQQRTDAFTEVVAQRYLAGPNMERVAREIRLGVS